MDGALVEKDHMKKNDGGEGGDSPVQPPHIFSLKKDIIYTNPLKVMSRVCGANSEAKTFSLFRLSFFLSFGLRFCLYKRPFHLFSWDHGQSLWIFRLGDACACLCVCVLFKDCVF